VHCQDSPSRSHPIVVKKPSPLNFLTELMIEIYSNPLQGVVQYLHMALSWLVFSESTYPCQMMTCFVKDIRCRGGSDSVELFENTVIETVAELGALPSIVGRTYRKAL
jgi:hypothetical protein